MNLNWLQRHQGAIVITLAAGGLLAGCGTAPPPPPTLYGWYDYQPQLYTYFKADTTSHQEQLVALEESLAKAEQAGTALPPGYRAHMGLLYASTGQRDLFKASLEAEKKHFPESTPFMDFALNNFAKLQDGKKK